MVQDDLQLDRTQNGWSVRAQGLWPQIGDKQMHGNRDYCRLAAVEVST